MATSAAAADVKKLRGLVAELKITILRPPKRELQAGCNEKSEVLRDKLDICARRAHRDQLVGDAELMEARLVGAVSELGLDAKFVHKSFIRSLAYIGSSSKPSVLDILVVRSNVSATALQNMFDLPKLLYCACQQQLSPKELELQGRHQRPHKRRHRSLLGTSSSNMPQLECWKILYAYCLGGLAVDVLQLTQPSSSSSLPFAFTASDFHEQMKGLVDPVFLLSNHFTTGVALFLLDRYAREKDGPWLTLDTVMRALGDGAMEHVRDISGLTCYAVSARCVERLLDVLQPHNEIATTKACRKLLESMDPIFYLDNGNDGRVQNEKQGLVEIPKTDLPDWLGEYRCPGYPSIVDLHVLIREIEIRKNRASDAIIHVKKMAKCHMIPYKVVCTAAELLFEGLFTHGMVFYDKQRSHDVALGTTLIPNSEKVVKEIFFSKLGELAQRVKDHPDGFPDAVQKDNIVLTIHQTLVRLLINAKYMVSYKLPEQFAAYVSMPMNLSPYQQMKWALDFIERPNDIYHNEMYALLDPVFNVANELELEELEDETALLPEQDMLEEASVMAEEREHIDVDDDVVMDDELDEEQELANLQRADDDENQAVSEREPDREYSLEEQDPENRQLRAEVDECDSGQEEEIELLGDESDNERHVDEHEEWSGESPTRGLPMAGSEEATRDEENNDTPIDANGAAAAHEDDFVGEASEGEVLDDDSSGDDAGSQDVGQEEVIVLDSSSDEKEASEEYESSSGAESAASASVYDPTLTEGQLIQNVAAAVQSSQIPSRTADVASAADTTDVDEPVERRIVNDGDNPVQQDSALFNRVWATEEVESDAPSDAEDPDKDDPMQESPARSERVSDELVENDPAPAEAKPVVDESQSQVEVVYDADDSQEDAGTEEEDERAKENAKLSFSLPDTSVGDGATEVPTPPEIPLNPPVKASDKVGDPGYEPDGVTDVEGLPRDTGAAETRETDGYLAEEGSQCATEDEEVSEAIPTEDEEENRDPGARDTVERHYGEDDIERLPVVRRIRSYMEADADDEQTAGEDLGSELSEHEESTGITNQVSDRTTNYTKPTTLQAFAEAAQREHDTVQNAISPPETRRRNDIAATAASSTLSAAHLTEPLPSPPQQKVLDVEPPEGKAAQKKPPLRHSDSTMLLAGSQQDMSIGTAEEAITVSQPVESAQSQAYVAATALLGLGPSEEDGDQNVSDITKPAAAQANTDTVDPQEEEGGAPAPSQKFSVASPSRCTEEIASDAGSARAGDSRDSSSSHESASQASSSDSEAPDRTGEQVNPVTSPAMSSIAASPARSCRSISLGQGAMANLEVELDPEGLPPIAEDLADEGHLQDAKQVAERNLDRAAGSLSSEYASEDESKKDPDSKEHPTRAADTSDEPENDVAAQLATTIDATPDDSAKRLSATNSPAPKDGGTEEEQGKEDNDPTKGSEMAKKDLENEASEEQMQDVPDTKAPPVAADAADEPENYDAAELATAIDATTDSSANHFPTTKSPASKDGDTENGPEKEEEPEATDDDEPTNRSDVAKNDTENETKDDDLKKKKSATSHSNEHGTDDEGSEIDEPEDPPTPVPTGRLTRRRSAAATHNDGDSIASSARRFRQATKPEDRSNDGDSVLRRSSRSAKQKDNDVDSKSSSVRRSTRNRKPVIEGTEQDNSPATSTRIGRSISKPISKPATTKRTKAADGDTEEGTPKQKDNDGASGTSSVRRSTRNRKPVIEGTEQDNSSATSTRIGRSKPAATPARPKRKKSANSDPEEGTTQQKDNDGYSTASNMRRSSRKRKSAVEGTEEDNTSATSKRFGRSKAASMPATPKREEVANSEPAEGTPTVVTKRPRRGSTVEPKQSPGKRKQVDEIDSSERSLRSRSKTGNSADASGATVDLKKSSRKRKADDESESTVRSLRRRTKISTSANSSPARSASKRKAASDSDTGTPNAPPASGRAKKPDGIATHTRSHDGGKPPKPPKGGDNSIALGTGGRAKKPSGIATHTRSHDGGKPAKPKGGGDSVASGRSMRSRK